ncbi:ATP-grasp domain-containing protein [Bacillus sp. MHSD_36]|uniref:ATP-grasp domain-containing protein n=1 Tax=unclassified Bacillus (in: firmicutes) TaxID=185979 RepID=UPI0027417EF0|nr:MULTISPECIES: ATP-grasp domain-containing protein [unclassified Bacillus (in: firmicutes)]MDP7992180.1 ATP-grasp domain-containing protein [Bacillus sp. MHSD_36]MDR4980964.1 ATP-grasp domain-containing protein [Bacillus sp. MHSD_37]
MLLLVDSGSRIFRKYILQNAKANNIPICLVKENPVSWEKPYIMDYITNQELQNMDNENKFDGIITYNELKLIETAKISEKINLPFHSSALINRCRNKYELRKFMYNKGLSDARSYLVKNEKEFINVIDKIEFPLILKPVSGYGSISVFKAESLQDVSYYFNTILNSFPEISKVVVEPYFEGPEVSVEILVFQGEICFIECTDKLLSAEPYFEERGHVFPGYKHNQFYNEIKTYIKQIVNSFEIENGAIHAEVRYTKQGPCLIELNLRIGGDFIPLLIQYATGIDFSTGAFEIALGKQPTSLHKYKDKGACIMFIIPDKKGTISHIKGLEHLKRPEVKDFYIMNNLKGIKTDIPPAQFLSRVGYFIVEDKTPQKAEKLANEIINKLEIIYETN